MSQPDHGRRRRWLRGLQLTLSLGLLIWLLASVDWRPLWEALLGASPAWMALVCVVYYIGVAISCLKWRTILAIEQIALPFVSLYRWYLIGAFVSNFLPTDVGGDIGRGYYAARQSGRPLAIARSIFIERLSGLAFMLMLAWLGIAVLVPGGRWVLLVAPVGLGLVLIGWLLWGRATLAAAPPWLRDLWRLLPDRLRNAWVESTRARHSYLRRPGALAQIAVISLVFQLLSGVGLWLNMRAIGPDLPLAPVVLTMALASAASLLPISVNGWGLREGVIVGLLAPLGVPTSALLALALLARALMLLVSLPGGLLLLAEGRRPPSAPKAPTSHHPRLSQ